jgi:hypothetical protein
MCDTCRGGRRGDGRKPPPRDLAYDPAVAFDLSKRLATGGALALLALPSKHSTAAPRHAAPGHELAGPAGPAAERRGCARADADGYLWVGTQDGLARFDGVSFTVFDRASTTALRHSMIACLRVDRAGRLWIGTRRGLVSYEGGVFSPEGPGERAARRPRVRALGGPRPAASS